MVSIIIPTYNEEKVIEKTVKQFIGMTEPHEVLVSDSQSTDRTQEIAKKYADKLVLDKEGKRGIAKGRNNGAREAKGEFLVFLDADVTIPNPSHFFKEMLAEFERDPKLVGLTVKVDVDPQAARLSDKIVCTTMNLYFGTMNNVFNVGMSRGEFMMMRADTFKLIKGFNEKLVAGEDVDLFYRLSRRGNVRTHFGLSVHETGRRFHEVGAAKTVYHWIRNALSVWFFKKAADKEWEAIR